MSLPSIAHAALVGIVEAGQQLHHRRLACSRFAHQGHRLPGVDVQIDAPERLGWLGRYRFGASGCGHRPGLVARLILRP